MILSLWNVPVRNYSVGPLRVVSTWKTNEPTLPQTLSMLTHMPFQIWMSRATTWLLVGIHWSLFLFSSRVYVNHVPVVASTCSTEWSKYSIFVQWNHWLRSLSLLVLVSSSFIQRVHQPWSAAQRRGKYKWLMSQTMATLNFIRYVSYCPWSLFISRSWQTDIVLQWRSQILAISWLSVIQTAWCNFGARPRRLVPITIRGKPNTPFLKDP